MTEILIGMDISGDSNYSNYHYLGIVVGTHESVMNVHNSMKDYPEHMASIDELDRQQIINDLDFDSKSRIALCVKLDRKNIVENILNHKRKGGRNLEKGKVLRTYNRVVMQQVKRYLEDFLFSHGVSITEIIIQCDSDCIHFAKAVGLKHTRKGVAYKLSDYIAWCNNKNRRPQTVREINFTQDIPTRMKKILNLR